MKFSLGQVLFGVAMVFLLATVIPPLLNANSDISVLIGVCVVVSLFYGVIKYGKTVLRWMGFNLEEENEEKGKW